MFLTLNRKRITTGIIAVALIGVFIFSISLLSSNALGVVKLNKTVVIDAGHGGIDGGVVGANGTVEAEINLYIAKSLKNYLERSGYTVVLTRKNADGLYDSTATNKKRSDMQKRMEIIENAKPDLVVSIHQNAYPRPSVSGAQVFYLEEGEGEELASLTQKILNSRFSFDKTAKKADYFILKSPYPSMLVECGFLSNATEEEKLKTPTYQQKVAYALFSAIHAHLGGEEKL